jgi:NAD(P)-dependent dehydrogenase (short-subunit alcohol dehydrogenase family)
MGTRAPVTDDRRVALVTGANRGIGSEVVRQLIEYGFRAILTARDEEQGRIAADELSADFVRLDVADDASVDRCFQTVEERHGRLDVLINVRDHSRHTFPCKSARSSWRRCVARRRACRF